MFSPYAWRTPDFSAAASISGLGLRSAEGLLAEDVTAGRGAEQAVSRMEVIGKAKVDGVEGRRP